MEMHGNERREYKGGNDLTQLAAFLGVYGVLYSALYI